MRDKLVRDEILWEIKVTITLRTPKRRRRSTRPICAHSRFWRPGRSGF